MAKEAAQLPATAPEMKGQSPSGLPAGCRAWVQEDHLLCGAVRGDEWGQLLGLTDTFDNLVS